MKKKLNPWMLAALCFGSTISCQHADLELDDIDGEKCVDTSKQLFLSGFDGVDIVVVVDNSGSMAEEQAMLSTQLFNLVNALVWPTADWPYPAVPSVRIAVVSPDMGVQYGGSGVAGGDVEALLAGCVGRGDNGRFQKYDSKTINIQPGAIKCNLQGEQLQCPTGWVCNSDGTDPAVGRCYPASGDGTNQSCPELNAMYAETPINTTPNYSVAFQTACLANLGTDGCGFEQQLQSAAKGLIHPDNQPSADESFYRANYLLAVLIVSDEEDCSIEDGKLFEAPEMDPTANPNKINIVCGENQEFLYTPQHFLDHFRKLKQDDFSTVFAAIVGVPPAASQGEVNTCEGKGSEITGCLERTEMTNVPVEEETGDTPMIVYQEACSRDENGTTVTKARPGRRYVELAQLFGDFGYVSSICNADWGPAMTGIASLIAKQIQGTCYPEQLQWDPSTKKSACDVYVEYENEAQCPFALEAGKEAFPSTDVMNDVVHEYLVCPLPRLAAALDCADAEQDTSLVNSDAIGWYYCEDSSSCKFNPTLTPSARDVAKGHLLVVNCPEDLVCE